MTMEVTIIVPKAQLQLSQRRSSPHRIMGQNSPDGHTPRKDTNTTWSLAAASLVKNPKDQVMAGKR